MLTLLAVGAGELNVGAVARERTISGDVVNTNTAIHAAHVVRAARRILAVAKFFKIG